eukprot:COSAG05_NODE_437_length_9835_cov_3.761915_10_plen_330_part_00
MDKISYITSQRIVTTTRREVQILQLLATQAHPHIVLFLGVFETPQHVQIVTEYLAGGTLYDRIVECNRLAEYEASVVFYRLLSTLDFMHSVGIVHRDFKPDNIILVDRTNNIDVKIIDFGVSNLVDAEGKCFSCCGTPLYMAPEMFADNCCYGTKADVWACGVIYFIMLSGVVPFWNDTRAGLIELINDCDTHLEFFEDDFEDVSEDAKDLIRRILVADPARRPSSAEVLRSDSLMEDVKRRDMLVAASEDRPWVPLDSRRWPANILAKFVASNASTVEELHDCCFSPGVSPVNTPLSSTDFSQELADGRDLDLEQEPQEPEPEPGPGP